MCQQYSQNRRVTNPQLTMCSFCNMLSNKEKLIILPFSFLLFHFYVSCLREKSRKWFKKCFTRKSLINQSYHYISIHNKRWYDVFILEATFMFFEQGKSWTFGYWHIVYLCWGFTSLNVSPFVHVSKTCLIRMVWFLIFVLQQEY